MALLIDRGAEINAQDKVRNLEFLSELISEWIHSLDVGFEEGTQGSCFHIIAKRGRYSNLELSRNNALLYDVYSLDILHFS